MHNDRPIKIPVHPHGKAPGGEEASFVGRLLSGKQGCTTTQRELEPGNIPSRHVRTIFECGDTEPFYSLLTALRED